MMRLTVKDLFCRRSAGVWLIEDLSFEAETGDILIIEGLDTAAGESLADVISGRRRPDGGCCLTSDDGEPVRTAEVSEDTIFLPYLSISESLQMVGHMSDNGKRVTEIMKALGMEQAAYKRPVACSPKELDVARLAAGLLAQADILIVNNLFSYRDPADAASIVIDAVHRCADKDVIVLIITAGKIRTDVKVTKLTEAHE